jgi:DtxR family transcriptional regulator, Mn-dependent transcriptional regulator
MFLAVIRSRCSASEHDPRLRPAPTCSYTGLVPGKLAARSVTKVAVSKAVDDYLKAILELGGSREERVSSNALAERLAVRPASVTGMLQKLASQQPPLVLYEKHHGVRLSAAGKRRGWEIVRHHRLLELFLHDVLKYSWDEVHDEAERLEHFISERFEDRVAAILGDPALDPHGHVIPQKDGAGAFRDEAPLLDWPVGAPAAISSVRDRDAAALRELERLGLVPDVRLTIEAKNPQASLLVRIDGQPEAIRLNNGLAASLFVMPPPARPSPGPQPSSRQISVSQKHPAKLDKPRHAAENRPPTNAPDESNNLAAPSRKSARHPRAATPKSP